MSTLSVWEVYEAIQLSPVTAEELAKKFHVEKKMIYRHTSKLRQKKLIRTQGTPVEYVSISNM